MAGYERSATVHRTGAPRSPARTPLVGRDELVEVLLADLADARLLTLTGPGGAGKTRLAQALFRAGQGSAESCWVELAHVQTPELVAETVAGALGAQPGGADAVDAVVDRLGAAEFLLVLDNCEHLVEACAELVDVLLDACPGLQVIATSREPLAVADEVTRPVPPLSDPAAEQLFTDRARAVVPDFAVTAGNAAAVGQLCRRLAGWPLSIELAAARMRVLTVEQIVAGLDDVFGLLSKSGSRGPARHHSLRSTLDWSHELLTPAEQVLFRRLAAFPGSFDLDAAIGVAAGDDLPATQVLDVLSRLVDRSLVTVRRPSDHARYRLLGPIRTYAGERLDAAGEREPVAHAHLHFYRSFVARAEPLLTGAEQVRTLDRLEAEASNLRAALAFARDTGRLEPGMQLAAGLWRLCYLRGHYREGRYWLDWAATVDQDAEPTLRAKALRGGGSLALLECDYPSAVRRLEAGLQLYRDAGDVSGTASVLQVLGSVAREQGRYGRAEALHHEALELFQASADEAGRTQSLAFLAFVAWLQTHWPVATDYAEQALAAARDLGDPESTAWALTSLGTVAQYTGEYDRAATLLAEAHELSVSAAYPEGIAWTLHEQGLLALRRGDVSADGLLLHSLERHRELGDRWRQASVLVDLAAAATERGRPQRAAALLGAAAHIRDEIGTVVAPCEQADHDRVEDAARAALGADLFATMWAAGQDSIEAALEVTDSDQAPREPAATAAPRHAPLRITMLGAARVRLGEHELAAADWGYGKPRELCFLLASGPGLTKAQIGLALWPEFDGSRLRNAFHTALREVRRALGDPGWIVYGNARYALDRSRELWSDVDAFESALRAADRTPGADALVHLQEAIAAYSGPFLPQLGDADWALERGAELHRALAGALAAAGRLLVDARRPGEAAEVYRRAVEHEPLDETAHRRLMRCLAAVGEPGRAVLVYRELSERLRTELGVAPAAETTAIYRQLTAR